MATVIKLIILALTGLIIFFKSIFTSQVLYWCTFASVFALVPLWWLAEYWVSKSKAAKILNEVPTQSFFVGKVSDDVNDDLIRGRLCFVKNEIKLVVKRKGKFEVKWSENLNSVTNACSTKVAGNKKGFILYTKEGETSFICNLADEVIKVILKP